MTVPPFSLPPGWGAELWGAGGWGGPVDVTSPTIQLIAALALGENLVQIQFDTQVYFSNLLDIGDASNPALFTMTPVPGTVGMDGAPVRPVTVASVALTTTDLLAGLPGASLDLTLDRPMTPWPAAYTLSVQGVVAWNFTTSGVGIDPGHSTSTFPAIFKQLIPPSVLSPVLARDIANPSSLSGAQGLPNPQNAALLGVFAVDDSHDYAIDSGIQSFKKRMYRRCVTAPGGFLHLGQSYGVGIPQEGKKLATASVQQRLASQLEVQIGQEPEVSAVKCTSTNDTTGLVRFNVAVKLKSGKAFAWSLPFPAM